MYILKPAYGIIYYFVKFLIPTGLKQYCVS